MNNVRFATAIHILTLMASYKDELLSSEFIAGSININAAIVRKEISNLRLAGLVQSKEGKGGGNALALPAKKIKLSDIYTAIQNTAAIMGKTNQPNPACAVGKVINTHINILYAETEAVVLKHLSKKTLHDFCNQFD